MIERDPIDWDMTGKPIYESIPKPVEIALQESIDSIVKLINENTGLRAELERIKAIGEEEHANLCEYVTAYGNLESELAACRKDAERYRWIRSKEWPEWEEAYWKSSPNNTPDKLDEAIDAAMSHKEGVE